MVVDFRIMATPLHHSDLSIDLLATRHYLCPMSATTSHTFPKAEKLKSRKQIDLLFREGKSFFAAPVKCYFRLTGLEVDKLTSLPADMNGFQVDGLTGLEVDKLSSLQVDETPNHKPQTINHKQKTINIKCGVSVSKRNFKHSVDRNRIKRLLREAYRLHKHTLAEKVAGRQLTLEVFFVFTDRTLPTFALVEEKMKYCIRRLGKIVEGGS
jgi:ribonuclease P protein component